MSWKFTITMFRNTIFHTRIELVTCNYDVLCFNITIIFQLPVSLFSYIPPSQTFLKLQMGEPKSNYTCNLRLEKFNYNASILLPISSIKAVLVLFFSAVLTMPLFTSMQLCKHGGTSTITHSCSTQALPVVM